jgi:SM-20-related protein
MPRIQQHEIESLTTNGYAVIPDFLSSDLQQALRDDVYELRSQHKFAAAKVGSNQSTNQLNTELRVTETCVLGSALEESSVARSYLYEILRYMRLDLNDNLLHKLDAHGGELLYLYYKKGGFYKRHVDAVPDSKSFQRCFSILLYLNKDWTRENAGQLRLYWYALCICPSTLNHLFLLLIINHYSDNPESHVDVEPLGGTLVLFQSDLIPHEVLDTGSERIAVVGWYHYQQE